MERYCIRRMDPRYANDPVNLINTLSLLCVTHIQLQAIWAHKKHKKHKIGYLSDLFVQALQQML